jgi:hypothetical protein
MSRVIVNVATGVTTVDAAYVKPDFSDAGAVPSSVPRGAFLVAAAAAGFISEATAEEAADGTWPAAFNALLSGLNAQQRVIAKANWSTASNIRRDAPLLAQIASKVPGADADALDDMFRAATEIET